MNVTYTFAPNTGFLRNIIVLHCLSLVTNKNLKNNGLMRNFSR